MTSWLTRLWGIAITVATLILVYGQYSATLGDQRPILDIHRVDGPEQVRKAYGEFSHYYVVKNFGKVTAHNVTLTVRTLRNGVEVHKDAAHNVGTLVPSGEMLYEIHVHDHQTQKLDLSRETMTEDVTIKYTGEKTPLRFWCSPVYSAAFTFHVDPIYRRWLRHPQNPSKLEADCL